MMETISVCFLHISVANVNQLISDSNLWHWSVESQWHLNATWTVWYIIRKINMPRQGLSHQFSVILVLVKVRHCSHIQESYPPSTPPQHLSISYLENGYGTISEGGQFHLILSKLLIKYPKILGNSYAYIFHNMFKPAAIWLSIICVYCLNVTTADTVTTADRNISLRLSSFQAIPFHFIQIIT